MSGKAAYAIMNFGGFLGIGEYSYPLPWSVLKYNPRLGGYEVNVTDEQLKQAPRFHDEWDWNDAAASRRIYDFYGVPPYLAVAQPCRSRPQLRVRPRPAEDRLRVAPESRGACTVSSRAHAARSVGATRRPRSPLPSPARETSAPMAPRKPMGASTGDLVEIRDARVASRMRLRRRSRLARSVGSGR